MSIYVYLWLGLATGAFAYVRARLRLSKPDVRNKAALLARNVFHNCTDDEAVALALLLSVAVAMIAWPIYLAFVLSRGVS